MLETLIYGLTIGAILYFFSIGLSITFGTMQPKAVVRDVGRALAMPYNEVDRLAKEEEQAGIERIAWEVIPNLAETIIREHVERLVSQREK